jgi:DNA-directed RNA polymerase subunit RPC12/RpoP
MATRKPKKSPFANDLHYYDCPRCGPKSGVGYIGRDLRGRMVYECSTCASKFGAPTLDQAARERRMRD